MCLVMYREYAHGEVVDFGITPEQVTRSCSIMSLQHTATHCNTLPHTATRCNTLQHTATHCNTVQHTLAGHSFVTHDMSFHSWLMCLLIHDSSFFPHLWLILCRLIRDAMVCFLIRDSSYVFSFVTRDSLFSPSFVTHSWLTSLSTRCSWSTRTIRNISFVTHIASSHSWLMVCLLIRDSYIRDSPLSQPDAHDRRQRFQASHSWLMTHLVIVNHSLSFHSWLICLLIRDSYLPICDSLFSQPDAHDRRQRFEASHSHVTRRRDVFKVFFFSRTYALFIFPPLKTKKNLLKVKCIFFQSTDREYFEYKVEDFTFCCLFISSTDQTKRKGKHSEQNCWKCVENMFDIFFMCSHRFGRLWKFRITRWKWNFVVPTYEFGNVWVWNNVC